MFRVLLTSVVVYFITQYICVGNSNILPKRKYLLSYNFLCVFCLYSFINVFIVNYNISFLITIVLFYLLSLTMYYVHEFRGTNVNFSDILSLNTAKEVAGGYKYEIKTRFLIVFIVIVLEFILNIIVYKSNYLFISGIRTNVDIYRFFWFEIRQLLCFFISFFLLKDQISKKQYDYSLNAGGNEGYIYNFVSSIPIFHRSTSDSNYTEETTAKFIKSVFNLAKENLNNKNTKSAHDYVTLFNSRFNDYVLKNEDVPNIIVIMNESFGSVHRRINANMQVTPYFDSLSGITKGNLYVNTFGGGTANTEFEFLTGMTIGNYAYPVMPYNNFVKRNKYSIAKYFKNLGYKTIAMHPYTATNYHRDKVYKRFGFDELLFYNDFKNKEYVRNFVSDKSMYEEVIRRFKAARNSSQKVFIFGITMQNHSGYKHFNGANILSLITNHEGREALDSYLSLMRISDEAIKVLIDYFDNIDDHVILLFFGDHNASFGTDINKLLYKNDLEYECTDAYETPFFIYDNKNRFDEYIKETSANFLSLELLKKAKLPLDVLHKMLNDIYKEYSVYNYHKAKRRKEGQICDIPFDKFMILEKEYLK